MPLKKPLLQPVAGHQPEFLDARDSHDEARASTDSAVRQVEREQFAQCIRTEVARQLVAGSNDIYEQLVQQVEATMIEMVMRDSKQNLTRAAQRLGLSRPTLRSKIRARMPYE